MFWSLFGYPKSQEVAFSFQSFLASYCLTKRKRVPTTCKKETFKTLCFCVVVGCLIIQEGEANLVRAKTQHSRLSSSHLEWQGNGGLRRPSLLLPKPQLHLWLQGFSCRWRRYTVLKFQQIGSGKPGPCLLQWNKLPVRSSKLQEHIGEVFILIPKVQSIISKSTKTNLK